VVKKNRTSLVTSIVFIVCFLWVFDSCSFDYGNKQEAGESQPDVVMENVDYVRVRGGDPVVRFQAERAERYEEKQTMNITKFSFEQFEHHGEDVNATGSAGEAFVELGSGNISLSSGVIIAVDSEDITIKTDNLDWQDKERRLLGAEETMVSITRSDGTFFIGRGFNADARSRIWEFTAGASGEYIDKDKEDDENSDELEWEYTILEEAR
jgi:LPS export ABC transporter protein LptC